MYEMGIRTLEDTGLSRGKSAATIGIVCAAVGSASALNMGFFLTMDWIWGLGLVIGGLLVVWAVQIYGANRFRVDLVNRLGASRKLGPWFNTLFVFLLPLQGVALLGWWLYDAATAPGYYDPNGAGIGAWDPLVLGTFGVGPCAIWWLTLLGILVTFAPWIGKLSLKGEPDAERFEGSPPILWKRAPFLLISIVPWVLYYWSEPLRIAIGDGAKGAFPWWILAAIIGAVIFGGFIRWAIRATRTPKFESITIEEDSTEGV
jgi:hypothetical protein